MNVLEMLSEAVRQSEIDLAEELELYGPGSRFVPKLKERLAFAKEAHSSERIARNLIACAAAKDVSWVI